MTKSKIFTIIGFTIALEPFSKLIYFLMKTNFSIETIFEIVFTYTEAWELASFWIFFPVLGISMICHERARSGIFLLIQLISLCFIINLFHSFETYSFPFMSLEPHLASIILFCLSIMTVAYNIGLYTKRVIAKELSLQLEEAWLPPLDLVNNEQIHQSKTVLVIDDDPESQVSIKEKIEAIGFKVISASNGKRGLAKAEKLKPNVILMDNNMPSIGGDRAVNLLRKNITSANIPVIGTSSAKKELESTRGSFYYKHFKQDGFKGLEANLNHLTKEKKIV